MSVRVTGGSEYVLAGVADLSSGRPGSDDPQPAVSINYGNPGCVALVATGAAGQPASCLGTPTHAGLVGDRGHVSYVVFACAAHTVAGSKRLPAVDRVVSTIRRTPMGTLARFLDMRVSEREQCARGD